MMKGVVNFSSSSSNRAERLLRVGLYDLEQTLGKGNFAIVRLGVHRLTKTKVAVKIVDKNDLDADNLKKISREIEIMRKLSHPNIIQVYQVMETDSMIYIVTEYAANGEIFDHLVVHGRMSEDEACHVFAQILSAVKYCHTHGVVHRDLKAENLLLDSDMNIKLADFGFSNYYSPDSLLSTWCGSPPYAAPELFEGKRYVGPKADIWSLGVVLYVLVSGYLPFDGATLQELRSRVIGCQYRIPFFLTTECENLLKGLIVNEPEKRLTLEQISRHPWTRKGGASNPQIIKLLDEISREEGPKEPPPINEALVEHIVRTVGVVREAVIDSVRKNKCDDISAMYRLLQKGWIEMEAVEREREQQQWEQRVIPFQPPLSPTSLTPFFSGEQQPRVTEIFNNDKQQQPHQHPQQQHQRQQQQHQIHHDDRLLNIRRHTLGQPNPAGEIGPPFFFPHQYYRGILPQNDLSFNLPLVCNQPPENFTVKDPHLLKPPAALGISGGVPQGRRASDGGAYIGQMPHLALQAAAAAAAAAAGLGSSQEQLSTTTTNSQIEAIDAYLNSKTKANAQQQQQQQQQPSSPASAAAVAVTASSNGNAPDSPRKRRTGLHTVMEKPPEISPDLVQEVEIRMRSTSPSPASCQQQSQPQQPQQQSAFSSALSPLPSPSKPSSSLRQRRTGLSTVMETGKAVPGASSDSLKDSLHLPSERFSPVRRLSEGSPAFNQYRSPLSQQSSLPSSNDTLPSDIKALQEEYHRLQLQTTPSAVGQQQQQQHSSPDSCLTSSGYLTPRFLSPPSTDSSSTQITRRCSDGGVIGGSSDNRPSPVMRTSHSATSEPLKQLYDEMYNTDPGSSNRRFSYPNSPVHNNSTTTATTTTTVTITPPPSRPSDPQPTNSSVTTAAKNSITQHLQQLCLQQKLNDVAANTVILSNDGTTTTTTTGNIDSPIVAAAAAAAAEGPSPLPVNNRWKGSITQGVPNRSSAAKAGEATLTTTTTTKSTSMLVLGQTMIMTSAPGSATSVTTSTPLLMAHSRSFDEAFQKRNNAIWSSKHHSVCAEDYNSLPANMIDSYAAIVNPEICVTNVLGEEIKLVLSEPMDESN